MKSSSRLDRTSTIALASAAVWALALLVAGLTLPVYDSTSTSSSGESTRSTQTLVAVNGPGILPVLAVPLLVTGLLAGALLLRGRRGGIPLAWALTALLVVFNLLAMLTIGIFVVPVTVALVVACVRGAKPAQPVSP